MSSIFFVKELTKWHGRIRGRRWGTGGGVQGGWKRWIRVFWGSKMRIQF